MLTLRSDKSNFSIIEKRWRNEGVPSSFWVQWKGSAAAKSLRTTALVTCRTFATKDKIELLRQPVFISRYLKSLPFSLIWRWHTDAQLCQHVSSLQRWYHRLQSKLLCIKLTRSTWCFQYYFELNITLKRSSQHCPWLKLARNILHKGRRNEYMYYTRGEEMNIPSSKLITSGHQINTADCGLLLYYKTWISKCTEQADVYQVKHKSTNFLEQKIAKTTIIRKLIKPLC